MSSRAKPPRRKKETPAKSATSLPLAPPSGEVGYAGLCSEAQADGVPCAELGRRCELCERADPERLPPF
jgi:hypothetical protein